MPEIQQNCEESYHTFAAKSVSLTEQLSAADSVQIIGNKSMVACGFLPIVIKQQIITHKTPNVTNTRFISPS